MFFKKVFSARKEGSYNILFFSLIILKSLRHRLYHSKNVTQKAEFLWPRYMFLFRYIIFSWFFFSLTWMQHCFYLLSLFLRVLLSKLSSLLLRSSLFPFPSFFLCVTSFLSVYSLPAPALISSWLWASVFCLIKISYQIVNEGIYELLSFWVNRPLIVIGNRQIHISLSVQLSL